MAHLKQSDVVRILWIFKNEKFSVAEPRVRHRRVFPAALGQGHRPDRNRISAVRILDPEKFRFRNFFEIVSAGFRTLRFRSRPIPGRGQELGMESSESAKGWNEVGAVSRN